MEIKHIITPINFAHNPCTYPINFTLPIKLIKIFRNSRITIKKTANTNLKLGDEANIDETALEMALMLKEANDIGVESCLLQWQKKIFSKNEINFYKDDRHCVTFLDHKYHDLVSNLDASELTNYIYTYTDVDFKTAYCKNYEDPESIVKESSSSSGEIRNRKKSIKPRQSDLKSKPIFPKDLKFPQCKGCLENGSKHQVMFVMADLDPEEFSEDILISILHSDEKGNLIITPDFNPKGKPYILQNKKFETFEYRIENVSEQIPKAEKDLENQKYLEICLKHSRYLKSCVGSQFEVPNHGFFKVYLMGEIVEATHFGNKNLYVIYNIDLPNGWSVSDTGWLSGMTQVSKPTIRNKIYTSNFSLPIEGEFELTINNFNSEDNLFKWPIILFEIASKDSWNCVRTEGYGFIEIPHEPGCYKINLSTWKPINPSPTAQLRNHFIGNMNELEDISYVRVPNGHQDGLISRLGFATETSGDLMVKLNILHQSQSFLIINEKKDLLSKLELSNSRNSIQSVLMAFQRARHKMLSARNKLYSPSKT